jgi:hypothetical protein
VIVEEARKRDHLMIPSGPQVRRRKTTERAERRDLGRGYAATTMDEPRFFTIDQVAEALATTKARRTRWCRARNFARSSSAVAASGASVGPTSRRS